ncbi:MAG: NACHT domain-containing protein, partial [Ardenticatenales bacterium]|nr:NACHT domain-containing protein [Ardenticatenales bacterium]
MQLSTELFRALVRFLSDLPLLRDAAERERLVDWAFHQDRGPYQALAPLERETQPQYVTRLVRALEGQRCGAAGSEWALLVYLEVLHADLGGGDHAGELASYLGQLCAYEEARAIIAEAGLDPSAATLEEIVAFYFDELVYDFALTAREYVDLAGEQTTLPAAMLPRGAGRRRGREELQAVLGIGLGHVALDGEHSAHDTAARAPVESVREKLLTVARGVLLGEPGSGKSWTLRQLALDYAALWHAGQSAHVPIFVELRHFSGMAEEARQSFADFVCAEAGVLGPYLERLIAEGRVLFLLDALNEMPRHSPLDKRDLVGEVRRYLTDKPRFVLSCRVRDYQDDLGTLRPLEQLYLRDLTPPQIREVLRRRLGAETGEALWHTMGGSAGLLGFWQKVAEHGEEARFWEAGHEWKGVYSWDEGYRDWQRIHREGARLIPLCRNPFMSHLLCWVYVEGERQLPGSRAELFKGFISKLLEREAWYAVQRGEIWPEQATIEEALVRVARAMQDAAGTVIPMADLDPAPDLIAAAIAANLLVVEGEDIRFSHQLLQEYFAARTLLEAMDGGEPPLRFFGKTWWEAGVWRETTVILGEFLGEGARGPNRVAQWLAPVSPEVALQVILRNGEGLTVTDLEPDTRAVLLASAQAKMTEVDPRGRAAAYRVLALLEA